MATRVPLAPRMPGRPWRTPRTRASGGAARKHKMEAQPEGVPLPKKRLMEAAMGDPPWTLVTAAATHIDAAATALRTSVATPSRPAAEMSPWEEMEEAPVAEEDEDAARRRLREIEERIIDDDDDDGSDGAEGADAGLAGRSGPGLPTLVLSDALKTGLRRDFEGGLTKKIIESMSRPSMELVLWKPLPAAFLGGRDKMATAKAFGTDAERRPPETLAFGSSADAQLQRTPARIPPHRPPPPPLLYGNADPAGGPSAEEEMEL